MNTIERGSIILPWLIEMALAGGIHTIVSGGKSTAIDRGVGSKVDSDMNAESARLLALPLIKSSG